MELLLTSAAVLKSMAIALAVGSSTIAVLQFFMAISDGVIDRTERRMLGIVYMVLRIAMALILFTSLIQAIAAFQNTDLSYLSPENAVSWAIIFVLYANALAMTRHWVSSKWGPAIQAGSWYTLGILSALMSSGINSFTYVGVFSGYLAVFLIALIIINLTMSTLARKFQQQNA